MLIRIRAGIIALLCFSLLTAGIPAVRAQAPDVDIEAVERRLTELMTMYDVPGVGVALISGGEVVYAGGLGVRDTTTGAPVTADTLFAIGSTTKSFTALGIMQLVDEGLVDLDAPVITYLPTFRLADADATQTLTLRQALSHTSGLPRADRAWYLSEETASLEEIVAAMADITPTARPGRTWQYNNQNFALAGYLIEHITGMRWEDYTRARILAPLGMETVTFDVAATEAATDHASPHRLNVRVGMEPIPFRGLGGMAPAGAINASAREMAAYALFQLGDGTFEGERIVSAEGLAEMHREQIVIYPQPGASAAAAGEDGPLFTRVGYGLGWITQTYRGVELVNHGGNVDGFSADVTLVPSAGAGVVLLANADLSALFIEVARLTLVEALLDMAPERDLAAYLNRQSSFDPAVIAARMEAARSYQPDPALIAPLLGEYSSPAGRLIIFMEGDQVFLRQITEGTTVVAELVPISDNEFVVNGIQGAGMQAFRFEIDEQGTVTMFQENIQAGQKLGEGVTEVMAVDPEGRYRFQVPQGLATTTLGNLIVLTATEPTGVFAAEAIAAEGDDPRANAERWFLAYDPTFDEPLLDSRQVPLPDGSVWTQLIYPAPGGQLSVALVRLEGGTAYFVGLVAAQADLPALTPALNQILLTFQVGE